MMKTISSLKKYSFVSHLFNLTLGICNKNLSWKIANRFLNNSQFQHQVLLFLLHLHHHHHHRVVYIKRIYFK